MNSYFILTCTGKIFEELHTDVHALKEEVDDCEEAVLLYQVIGTTVGNNDEEDLMLDVLEAKVAAIVEQK
jgi:hypothetical protein